MQPRAGVSSASPYFVVRNAPKTNKPQAAAWGSSIVIEHLFVSEGGLELMPAR